MPQTVLGRKAGELVAEAVAKTGWKKVKQFGFQKFLMNSIFTSAILETVLTGEQVSVLSLVYLREYFGVHLDQQAKTYETGMTW